MVLVFNCDENFNLGAMHRIFCGLCEMGAWGCFDEFNRLDEVSLSAVSLQIQCIQSELQKDSDTFVLENMELRLMKSMGIFVTMNPKYVGRSQLPENLKQLFRGFAMVSPDRTNIAQVKLYTQGFIEADDLSKKIVLLFELCKKQLSAQEH
jgi:dynein heavy chain 1